jgi:hypothetical protein
MFNNAKYKFSVLKRSNKYMKNGGIVLFDRFPQTQFTGIFDGPNITSLSGDYKSMLAIRFFAYKEERLFKKFNIFNPNIVFKLLLPAEISVSRKPDHDFNMIQKKCSITEQLEFNNSIVYKIDATQDYDSEILEVKRLIWEAIIKHV